MNLSQAKTQLEKIIALYKSMSADEKNISAIERDLMLGYIRSLYENFLDATPSVSSNNDNRSKPTYTPPPVLEPVVVEAPPPPVVERPKVETPAPPVVELPKVEAPAPRPVEPPPPPRLVEQPKPVAPTPVPEPVRYEPTPVAPTPRSESSTHSAEIEELFEAPSNKELSDRLSNTAIEDLTKAFGLNDRLLMQNELFANNKAVFDEILKDLNNASSFDSAKGYLVDFAKRYNWVGNSDRQKHAKWFIRMVRRRFK